MSDIIVRVDGWDLVKEDGSSEPRIRDLDLAARLEYSRTRDIRKLIERLQNDGHLPNIAWRDTVARQELKSGGVHETPVREYLLTEEEALLVTTQSKTEKAMSVTKEIIAVFVALRRGLLAAPNQSAELALMVSSIQALAANVAQSMSKFDELREKVENQNHTIGDRGARAVSCALATYSLAIAGPDKKKRRSVHGLAEVTLRAALQFTGVGARWAAFPANRWPELKAKLDEFDRMVRRSGLLQGALPNV